MTTADIVFAQPGNPDRLRDYEQDARTVFWALLVAILIHLLVAFLLAAFSGFFSPALPTPGLQRLVHNGVVAAALSV